MSRGLLSLCLPDQTFPIFSPSAASIAARVVWFLSCMSWYSIWISFFMWIVIFISSSVRDVLLVVSHRVSVSLLILCFRMGCIIFSCLRRVSLTSVLNFFSNVCGLFWGVRLPRFSIVRWRFIACFCISFFIFWFFTSLGRIAHLPLPSCRDDGVAIDTLTMSWSVGMGAGEMSHLEHSLKQSSCI